jgi:gamma-glutamyltranspeptidase / glutathione hydrolase
MPLTHRAAALAVLLLAGACATTPPQQAPSQTDAGVPARAASGTATYWGDRRPAEFPAEWPHKAGRAATFGTRGMVASDAPIASQVGVDIMAAGGNAVDAAVAVGFALAVVYPEAGNIGGGGYMVIRMADGQVAALDYREMAPAAATRDMFLDAAGNTTDASTVGALASGVPGAVAGMLAAHGRFGALPLRQVLAPAIRLARDGFQVDAALAASVASNSRLIGRFDGAALLLPGGRPVEAGSVLRQPALAATLERIAAQGADGFYRGDTPRMIAATMRRLGGIITEADLSAYKAEWREPVRSTYRGHTLLTMPPSSSGGVTITETLNILEGFADVGAFGSARNAHLLGSAYQRAFIDRNEKLADPAFVRVPMEQLTSREYAARLRATIDETRATPTPVVAARMRESDETTHYSVVDQHGNAVATTTTINGLYGSGVFIPDAGFFMNNEMDDFATRPGFPNMFGLVQGEANAVAPGKRMLSAMSPTIVLDRDGSLLLVVGSRGGPRIITSVSQVVLNVLDHRMVLSDAVSAPRIHHQALPDSLRLERNGFAPVTIDALRAMGHAAVPFGGVGLVNAIMRVPDGWEGMSDPRSSGKPIGWN